MIVYLSSPGSQMHADHLRGMPTLISYAVWSRWLDDYTPSFGRILLDSGAFSELTGKAKVDLSAYMDWARARLHFVDAAAGLDDIRGDWRRSLRNYEAFPEGFPTFHESDPFELLDDLIAMALERNRWLGIGLIPPRQGKERWLRQTCDRIPPGIHVHGWALREYTDVARLDSVDSTNWLRDAWQYRNQMPFLTPAECVELVVKRYQRWQRTIRHPQQEPTLFDEVKQC